MEFNIADLFESVADAVPDRTAVVSGERRLTRHVGTPLPRQHTPESNNDETMLVRSKRDRKTKKPMDSYPWASFRKFQCDRVTSSHPPASEEALWQRPIHLRVSPAPRRGSLVGWRRTLLCDGR